LAALHSLDPKRGRRLSVMSSVSNSSAQSRASESEEHLGLPPVVAVLSTATTGGGSAGDATTPQPPPASSPDGVDVPTDPAQQPEAYVRHCAAVVWMRLADVDNTSTRSPAELRCILNHTSTQPLGPGLQCWLLALWGLAHDPINSRRLVRLGAMEVVLARVDELRRVIVKSVESLAELSGAEELRNAMGKVCVPCFHLVLVGRRSSSVMTQADDGVPCALGW